MSIKFGPSGNSEIFYKMGYKKSVEAPKFLKNFGLNAYEYSFGRGYTMGNETAISIGNEAEKNGISVSIHAPYYINFANESDEMAEKSYNYILTGLKLLKLMKGNHLVFHVASQGKQSRENAINLTRERVRKLVEKIYENGYDDMNICPETMGKPMQIGTYKEIIDICEIDKILVPTFDFGHIYSLNLGEFGIYDDYKQVFEYAILKLGFERASNCHIHFSKIEYGNKGEIRHLNFEDDGFGPDFYPLAQVIKDMNLTPTIICESHSKMAEDALTMKQIYENLK